MTLILLIDLLVVVSLVAASRRCLELALPLFCFYLVLMPLESRLVVSGLFDLSTGRVAMLTLVVLFLIRRERRNDQPLPMKQLMYLHISWALCSTLYSLSMVTSVKQLIGQVVEYYLLYYILLKTISDLQTVYKMVYSMMIAMGLCCIFGLFEAYGSWSILRVFPSNLWITYGHHDPLYIEWGRGLRVRSTFPHPILFGDALAMSIPMVLYLLSIWKQRLQRVVLWSVLILMFWAIYKTSSRGPWIAVGISSVLLFVLVNNRVRRYLAVMLVLSLVVLISRPGIRKTIVDLYVATQDTSSVVGSSYEYRHALTDAVRNAVAKAPGRALFGYGPGTFRELGLEINFLDQVQRWHTCDNNWALFLYETGYGGLISIGILLITPLLMALKGYRRVPRPEKYFVGVVLISLIVFYVGLLSVAGYNWGQQGYMAWIFISFAALYPRLAVRHHHKPVVPKSPVQVTTPTAEPAVSRLQFI